MGQGALAAGFDVVNMTEELIALANEKGGKDNISVILAGLREAYSDSVGLELESD